MPTYITDTHFFSDQHGIRGKQPQTKTEVSSLAAPWELTLTFSSVPAEKTRKCSALFLLNDDHKDFLGKRFQYIFDCLLKQGYAIFHFQLGKEGEPDFFKNFEAQKEQLLQQYPQIDRTQLAIAGFGHGVSSMLYVTGHSKDFFAAVSINGFVNYTTAYGNYEGYHQDFLASGAADFKSWLLEMAAQCPLKYLDMNQTPYLILHAHRDYICPEEQSEELFSGIKDRIPEIPCRMVIFPEENHDFLLPGHDRYRERLAEEILTWLSSHCAKNKMENDYDR